MKILQLSPQFPFPPDNGGKIGIANILKEYSNQGIEVIFLAFYENEINPKFKEEASKYCKLILIKHSTKNSKLRLLKSLIQSSALFISKHICELAILEIEKIIKNDKIDFIHCDHTSMAYYGIYFQEKYKIPFALRLHNVEYTIWHRYYEELAFYNPLKYYIKSQAKKLKKYEAYAISKADVNFAITKEDEQRAKLLASNANIIIASAGVDLSYWQRDKSINQNSNEFLIATTFDWIHNANAIKWLIENVLVILDKQNIDYKFNIIGKNPPEWLLNYNSHKINILGYVEDVMPYFNQSSFYLAPLFVGGGIRIKILEALSMELPVIATSVSAEGILETANNKMESGIIISDNPEEFAKLMIKLINDTQNRKELANAARLFIENNYTWHKSINNMIYGMNNILDKK